jgi:hypothetical protein
MYSVSFKGQLYIVERKIEEKRKTVQRTHRFLRSGTGKIIACVCVWVVVVVFVVGDNVIAVFRHDVFSKASEAINANEEGERSVVKT